MIFLLGTAAVLGLPIIAGAAYFIHDRIKTGSWPGSVVDWDSYHYN